ncbi:MAG: shikimate kinase [Caulobacter sp.]|nr:shikimate kinase [Caulobacter sp.]
MHAKPSAPGDFADDGHRPVAIVLVGLPGVGKSTVGRQLATLLDLPFVDSDKEIEAAAQRSVAGIFESLGEAAFRDGERRVIARLLDGQPKVIATGGGAFLCPQTRQRLAAAAFTVWLRKDVEAVIKRLGRGRSRPLLRGADPGAILRRLAQERYPIYAAADLTFDLDGVDAPAQTLGAVLKSRLPWLRSAAPPSR